MNDNDNDDDSQKSVKKLDSEDTEKIRHLIEQLQVSLDSEHLENSFYSFYFILKKYQNAPQLLDPYLESFLCPLIQLIKDRTEFDDFKHTAFKYIYIIMSIKKYKNIAIYLPHEVSDFNTVLEMLEKQDIKNNKTWQTRYVLIIWLSIVCKIPFALSLLEPGDPADENPQQSITLRVIDICKRYCFSKDSCSIAAIYLVANFITRYDVKDNYLENIITWCLDNFENDNLNYRPLAVIAAIFKYSRGDDLVPYTQLILDKIMKTKLSHNSNDLIRKYIIKIIQRIGTVLLKPNIRYCKKESNTINLYNHSNESGIIESTVDAKKNFSIPKIEYNKVPQCIEDILEYLIAGLQDKSLIIRWSSAKGIGRVTAKLPIDFADDVLSFVLTLFTSREIEIAWHGGCLALAELGKRGLLLQQRLPEIINYVIHALKFDEPRSYGPIGSIIRDAACYVCWSFARAMKPEVLDNYIREIATGLLIVTCFDREINCRRAASAAFQEIVGRLGNFPNGIEMVSASDYNAVGIRTNAYLKISVYIANFGYLKPFCEHLLLYKIIHWDITIRELTGKTLQNLTALSPSYMVTEIFPSLMNLLNSTESNHCHGAILAIADILLALYNTSSSELANLMKVYDARIEGIVLQLRSRGQFKGLGGEILKQACNLVKNLSIMHFRVQCKDTLSDWQYLLEESLTHDTTSVRAISTDAQTVFFTEYYMSFSAEERRSTVDRYLDHILSTNHLNRYYSIGFVQAVGFFPVVVLQGRCDDIFTNLVKCFELTNEAECRKEAIDSLTKLCSTLGLENLELWRPYIQEVYEIFFKGLSDYTIDNHGDVGSWVREAAISGLHSFTALIHEAGCVSVLTEDLMTKVIGSISQQSVERLDRTRAKAGFAIYSLISSDLPNIPYHAELKQLFDRFIEEEGSFVDWKMESKTFPLFVTMLSYPPYVPYVLKGMIYSIACLSESVVKYSSMSLLTFIQKLEPRVMKDVCEEMCNILESCTKDERLVLANLTFIDRLLNLENIFANIEDPECKIAKRILAYTKAQFNTTKITHNRLISVKIFCHLLQVRGSISKNAFIQLSICLCHKQTCIRKATAYGMYESLILYGQDMDLSEDNLAVILNHLNNVDWQKPVPELRPIRNQLCEIMKCPIPVIKKTVS